MTDNPKLYGGSFCYFTVQQVSKKPSTLIEKFIHFRSREIWLFNSQFCNSNGKKRVTKGPFVHKTDFPHRFVSKPNLGVLDQEMAFLKPRKWGMVQ